jgi:hypothetical protein
MRNRCDNSPSCLQFLVDKVGISPGMTKIGGFLQAGDQRLRTAEHGCAKAVT